MCDGRYFRHRTADISHPVAKIGVLWRKYLYLVYEQTLGPPQRVKEIFQPLA